MKYRHPLWLATLSIFTLLSASPPALALEQAYKEALQSVLKLNAEQTDSVEVILLKARELGEFNRNQFDDSYYELTMANLATMDTVRRQVDSILTDSQRIAYTKLRKSSEQRFSSPDGEALTRRLLLDSAQSRTIDMILTYAEQDVERIRRESSHSGGGFGQGFRSSSFRGAMLRRQSKMRKAYKAIEKLLTKAQRKKFKEYVAEQLEQFRPQDGAGDRDHDGGF